MSSFPSNVETNRIESDDMVFPEAAFSETEQTREAEPELPSTDSNIELPDDSPDQSVTSSEESEDSINQHAAEQNSSEISTPTSAPQDSTPEGLPEMLLQHPVFVNMHQFQPRCGCRSNIGFSQHYDPRPSCSCRASCPCNSFHQSNVGRMFPPSFVSSIPMMPPMMPQIMPPMVPPMMPQMMSPMHPMMTRMPSMSSMSSMPPMPPSMMPPRMMKVLYCSKKTTE